MVIASMVARRWQRAHVFRGPKLSIIFYDGDTTTSLSVVTDTPIRPSRAFSAASAAAARALSGQEDLSAEEVARRSMEVRCSLPSLVGLCRLWPSLVGSTHRAAAAVLTAAVPRRCLFFQNPGVFPGIARCSCVSALLINA